MNTKETEDEKTEGSSTEGFKETEALRLRLKYWRASGKRFESIRMSYQAKVKPSLNVLSTK